jgi:transcriptional regulator with XRE-family HTH domain
MRVPTLPNLRRLRDRALLTQEELAARAGVARSTLVKLERLEAKARPSTIRKLAEALGCTPWELMQPDEYAGR